MKRMIHPMLQNAQSLVYTTPQEIGQCQQFNGLQITDGYAALMVAVFLIATLVISVLSYSSGYGNAKKEELERERDARPQRDADSLSEERRKFFQSLSLDKNLPGDEIERRMKAWDAEKFTV